MADERPNANGLVSVIMPCCGHLEYTQLSVPRVMRHSRHPFEVLFVEAGSLDGTREYLAGVAATAPVHVEILRASKESAFAQLVAKALAEARGAFIGWVNNDVLVTEMWLQQLVALATANEIIGLVGPMANLAQEQQRVKAIPYRLDRPSMGPMPDGTGAREVDTQTLDRFAEEYRQANKGQWTAVEQVGGFCWLAKREIFDRVDLLEKGSDEGIFDACGFSDRVRRTGYRLACCRDMYVHHFGSHLLEG